MVTKSAKDRSRLRRTEFRQHSSAAHAWACLKQTASTISISLTSLRIHQISSPAETLSLRARIAALEPASSEVWFKEMLKPVCPAQRSSGVLVSILWGNIKQPRRIRQYPESFALSIMRRRLRYIEVSPRAAENWPEIVDMLLESGADSKIPDTSGRPSAKASRPINRSQLTSLIEHPASLNCLA